MAEPLMYVNTFRGFAPLFLQLAPELRTSQKLRSRSQFTVELMVTIEAPSETENRVTSPPGH